VEAVDTTAAGDAFCGALADALARGEDLGSAAGWAGRVAAATCTKPGAQASMPTRDEALAIG
jgi:ribokinase